MRNMPLKSCLVAAGVALALAAGTAAAQSGTSQPPESPPTAIPPTSAPPPDQQATPAAVPPASSTSTPATQSSSAVPPADAAKPMPTATAGTFDDLDQNKDSGLGKDEVIADMTLSSSFATYDSDGDGKLNREEYAKYKSKNQANPLPEKR